MLTSQHAAKPPFLTGGGELGELIAAFDWSRTSLGPISAWPAHVRTTVGLILKSPVPLVSLWGPEGIMIYNDAYSVFAGKRHPQLLGSEVRQGWPEVAEFNDHVMKVGLAGGTLTYTDQELTLCRNGEPEQVWMNLNYSPISDEEGRPVGVIAVVAETTQEVRTKAQLRERQEQLSGFIAQSTAGFAQVDLEGRFMLVNDRYCEITGRSREQLAKLRMQDITHPDDLAANMELFQRAIADGQPFTYEKRYVRPDGSHVWVNNSVSITRRANGEPYGVTAVSVDMTDRRMAEESVRENEARLRALTDNLPGGMVYQIATSRDGQDRRFLFVSESFEKLTGYPASAVAENPMLPYELVLPEDRQALAAAEDEAIRSLATFDAEARFRQADGSVRWGRIISAPREQPDGSLVWDGIQIDVTEQKRAEEALRKSQNELKLLNETLEQRVEERTRELESLHEQLRHSQKLETIGQLTGGVAHDFNNLLTPIVGALDILKKRTDEPRTMRLIDGALTSAERARILITRLLSFARRQRLESRDVSVRRLLAGTSDLLKRSISRTVHLAVDLPDKDFTVRADPNQLELALLNLVVNARDALDDGGRIGISATCERVDAPGSLGLEPGDYVRLRVSDNGRGMDAETLGRAIEPFYSTKEQGKGTGLGLSMVHGLALQSGGELHISSAPGAGTTVDLWLPAGTGDAEPFEPEEEEEVAAAAPLKILLVDDEDLVRTATADMLMEVGHTVHQAHSGGSAVAIMENDPNYDLLVTDYAMPLMSGAALIRRARELSPNISVLLVTGYANAAVDVPADVPRVEKPFRASELIRRVNETIRDDASAADANAGEEA